MVKITERELLEMTLKASDLSRNQIESIVKSNTKTYYKAELKNGLEKKGYFMFPIPDDYKPTPSLRWFYEGRECDTPDTGNPKRLTEKSKELGTVSGKIEFGTGDGSSAGKQHSTEKYPLPPDAA